MGRKRKRTRPSKPVVDIPSAKRLKVAAPNQLSELIADSILQHPVLSLYYHQVFSLRKYFLSRLPASSRARRKKIATLGRQEFEKPLADLLDSTLVGIRETQGGSENFKAADVAAYSQQQLASTVANSLGSGSSSQSEVIDFAIWLLFNRKSRGANRPPHLLCHGYQRSAFAPRRIHSHNPVESIPGLVSHSPNPYVDTVKSSLWGDMLSLLGKEGERLMIDLVLDCGIFSPVSKGIGNFYQISGVPLSELSVLEKEPSLYMKPPQTAHGVIPLNNPPAILHTPGNIVFVRSRMLYARAAVNAKGEVSFGMRHIHVLNRYPNGRSSKHTIHLMKYIFPRQFGLHNVFTSAVDFRETAQPFKDYTLREQEIAQAMLHEASRRRRKGSEAEASPDKIPKRLRGVPFELTGKLQKLHARCSYTELLRHYCPREVRHKSDKMNPAEKVEEAFNSNSEVLGLQQDVSETSEARIRANFTPLVTSSNQKQQHLDFATPPAQVSAFCRAVIGNVFPNDFWGIGDVGVENQKVIMRNVDRFIHLRKFENQSLHEVVQDMKVTHIPWLCTPKQDASCKVSLPEMRKRCEIFLEFAYYIFDSFLIPLVRSNFHVTESNRHSNRLFYFRHDVWRSLTEPALAGLRLSMFEEMKVEKARMILDTSSLAFSQIRLLPKQNGVRMIMNLRRRVMRQKNGRKVLGRSINSVLAPVHNMLRYEKRAQPEKLGSALFSVGDMHPRLKQFKQNLQQRRLDKRPLFFAKVDVQSCFDTMPQNRVVRLVEKLVTEDKYCLFRHAEIRPPQDYEQAAHSKQIAKPRRKFVTNAKGASDSTTFAQEIERELAPGGKNTVFVDNVVQQVQDTERLLDLLDEHVQQNMVKIGKKYYRQKRGVPQGSVLSSLLCNFFYADLEQHFLGFLDQDSLLLRLIDDFLLITLRQDHAERFLQIMHDGKPSYGVSVNPDKSLVNFDVCLAGKLIRRQPASTGFPYCGNIIDPKTLDISRDWQRKEDTAIANSLTVEFSKLPGKTFHRKALNALKIQAHAMLLDTAYNSLSTVYSNLYRAFRESAMKIYRYVKCLPQGKRPRPAFFYKTIEDVLELAFVLTKSKQKSDRLQQYRCVVTKTQLTW
ncbi:MAG: hypothetical protein M1819_004390 [Sarea resinae]|nr:MAG: hypothetical protein M1819_004390 [Sarea resinae]